MPFARRVVFFLFAVMENGRPCYTELVVVPPRTLCPPSVPHARPCRPCREMKRPVNVQSVGDDLFPNVSWMLLLRNVARGTHSYVFCLTCVGEILRSGNLVYQNMYSEKKTHRVDLKKK